MRNTAFLEILPPKKELLTPGKKFYRIYAFGQSGLLIFKRNSASLDILPPKKLNFMTIRNHDSFIQNMLIFVALSESCLSDSKTG